MRALISVSDKTNLIPFAKDLVAMGVEIISTGGTAKLLSENHIPVKTIDEITGFPECLDGRVKTLHPKVHGGLLAVRSSEKHMATCRELGIEMIDIVVVNLYPFEATIAKPDVAFEEAIENIDIGGPSMLRSAAKNHASVTVIVSPERYSEVSAELRKDGVVSAKTRGLLALDAFSHTAAYDGMIAQFLKSRLTENEAMPEEINVSLSLVSNLRYGENPHQKAGFYRTRNNSSAFSDFEQCHGKELSYNNIMDMEAAWQISQEFDIPGVAIIKHTNPCGAAVADTILEAYQKAYEADPVSAFGSIVGLNRCVDLETAEEIGKTFVEVVIAPDFDDDALAHLQKKSAIRLIRFPKFSTRYKGLSYRHVAGGFLVQDSNSLLIDVENLSVVTNAVPSPKEMNELRFAYALVKHVKSNAIVITRDGISRGVGAGQMSRIDSAEIAIKKAGEFSTDGVLASDAFLPFGDTVALAAAAGIRAIIQPGGSKRDQESIDRCNEHGIAMVFTGVRHFKH
jgi:phosphoribosylaminoimidazolecarboxamide formyltransferase / IMP cyclohydrolase